PSTRRSGQRRRLGPTPDRRCPSQGDDRDGRGGTSDQRADPDGRALRGDTGVVEHWLRPGLRRGSLDLASGVGIGRASRRRILAKSPIWLHDASRGRTYDSHPTERLRPMTERAGKVAIVTGASGGIGRAIAVRLARDGAVVAACYLGNEDQARETARAIE